MFWPLFSQVELSRFKVQELQVLAVVYLEVLLIKLSSIDVELGNLNVIWCLSDGNIRFHKVVDD